MPAFVIYGGYEMSKIIDITEKLNFEEKPKIKIKDTVVEVNNDAVSMLKVAALFDEETIKTSDIYSVYNLIFDEPQREKIEALKLSFKDFTTLITETTKNIIGGDEDTEGETATPATT